MENWQEALNTFLKRYEKEPFFEGALLCGSYACGNQNSFSDIDVNILVSNSQNWRERGNIKIDGFLIEYFINPINQIQQEFQLDLLRGRTTCATMFAYGKIITDKNGYVKKLQKEAKTFLKKAMPKYRMSDLALDFYLAWNTMDELNSLAKDKLSLGLVYNYLLENLIILYFKANRIPKIPLTKIEKVFTNAAYAKRYHAQQLPNKKFISLFLLALQKQNIRNIRNLYNYVMDKLGGFDIAQFKMHSKLKNAKSTSKS